MRLRYFPMPCLACCWISLVLLERAIISGTASATLTLLNNNKLRLQEDTDLQTRLVISTNPAHFESAGPGDLALSSSDQSSALAHSDTNIEHNKENPGHFKHILPFAIVDGSRLNLSEALQDGHPDLLQCELEVGGRMLHLDLEKNQHLLTRSPNIYYYLPNGTRMLEKESSVIHCYYHGTVRGFPQSRVALSTCSGLRGVIVVSANQSYVLEPEEKMGDKEKGLHVMYPTSELEFEYGGCGVTHSEIPHIDVLPQQHRWKRDILSEIKYIELVLVVDHKEYQNYQKNNKTIINRMLDLANQVDWFYRPLNVRVALLGMEIWSDKDKILVDKNPTDTLNRFLEWRTHELLPRLRHDNAQLIMGGSFDGTTVGMASQSSMCSKDRSGGVNVDHLVSVLGIASTVAHELGHNLGMSHDTPDRHCQCQNEARLGGCIMEPSTGFLPGQLFSSCSAQDLAGSLLHGGGMCLFNVPEPERLLGGPRCGNLYVEKGEECDCGLTDECQDPCCNATTCKLVPGAQCSSDGICCEDCKLRSAGWVCRDPLGECDLPEYCTGHSPYCPPNVFIQNGQSCQQGESYCYSGVCASLSSQCQVLWGPNSTQAPDVCFSSVNKRGNKYGNCGQLPNGTYISCPQPDVHCGKIQCQGGNDRPLLGSNAEIITTTVMVNRSEFTCRGTYFNLGDDVSDPAMVAPGIACGKGKACVDRQCQGVTIFGVQECQKKCNGHGVCNSNKNCHCHPGWAPPDCKYGGYGGSMDSGPAQGNRESNPARMAMLIIFLFILPVALLCLALIYRRRIQGQHCLGSNPFNKGDSRQQSRTPVRERSNIQNGEQVQPLRYQWMQNADIPLTPPAIKVLNRPAPPSKPLPPDPVSRDVQLAVERPAAPNKPLPPDPVLRDSQIFAPAKPPPPRKPLPADPPLRPVSAVSLQHTPSVSSVPTYGPHVAVVPARRAPPPPVGDPQLSTTQPPHPL
ncbi:disintegrin and metalloproteinase domain-containing protein 15 isoform X1 [Amia ocellicauda]|uniref:disintegrin and metalloproteinase domain-containing protein 15 isoform X1 n=1 Tax=Amia ocellicauda TaxID=2972642 RepID=UPI0034638F00